MAEVRWTFEAMRCLEEIHGYIAAGNPWAAKFLGAFAFPLVVERFGMAAAFLAAGGPIRASINGAVG